MNITSRPEDFSLMVIRRDAEEYRLLPWFVERVLEDEVFISASVAAFARREDAEEYLKFLLGKKES